MWRGWRSQNSNSSWNRKYPSNMGHLTYLANVNSTIINRGIFHWFNYLSAVQIFLCLLSKPVTKFINKWCLASYTKMFIILRSDQFETIMPMNSTEMNFVSNFIPFIRVNFHFHAFAGQNCFPHKTVAEALENMSTFKYLWPTELN